MSDHRATNWGSRTLRGQCCRSKPFPLCFPGRAARCFLIRLGTFRTPRVCRRSTAGSNRWNNACRRGWSAFPDPPAVARMIGDCHERTVCGYRSPARSCSKSIFHPKPGERKRPRPRCPEPSRVRAAGRARGFAPAYSWCNRFTLSSRRQLRDRRSSPASDKDRRPWFQSIRP